MIFGVFFFCRFRSLFRSLFWISFVYLVVAPFLDGVKMEYVFAFSVLALGVFIYFPFIYFRLSVPGSGKCIKIFLYSPRVFIPHVLLSLSVPPNHNLLVVVPPNHNLLVVVPPNHNLLAVFYKYIYWLFFAGFLYSFLQLFLEISPPSDIFQ